MVCSTACESQSDQTNEGQFYNASGKHFDVLLLLNRGSSLSIKSGRGQYFPLFSKTLK